MSVTFLLRACLNGHLSILTGFHGKFLKNFLILFFFFFSISHRVKDAKGCFILTDGYTDNRDAAVSVF